MMIARKGFASFPPLKSLAASPPPSILFSSFFSTSSSSFSSASSSELQEEKWRSLGVSVWWDVGDCPVPEGVDPSTVSQSIKAAVRANGMNGPVQISALADIFQLPKSTWKTLYSTGIAMTHVRIVEKKNRSYGRMLSKLYSWADKIPRPVHLFLITDRDFSFASHQLRWKNYNILLASNEPPGLGVLCGAASVVWRWDDLVTNGENSIGKYYNQPPDASLYGHYNVPLEDPLLVADDEPCSRMMDTNSGEVQVKKACSPHKLLASPPPQLEEEWRSVPVYVLWDFQSCPVPEGVNLLRVSKAITEALRANGMKGPIYMSVSLDHSMVSAADSDALFTTGFIATGVSNGEKERIYKKLMSLVKWIFPPEHLFLITNWDFSSTLQEFRETGYNIVVASNEEASGDLRSAASIVWRWDDLVKGENSIGKHYNQPPPLPRMMDDTVDDEAENWTPSAHRKEEMQMRGGFFNKVRRTICGKLGLSQNSR